MGDLVVATARWPSCHQQNTCRACRSLARGSRLSKRLLPEQPARQDRRNSKQNAKENLAQIRGIPSKTPAITEPKSRELQAKGPGEPSSNRGNSKQKAQENRAQIQGTPSKWQGEPGARMCARRLQHGRPLKSSRPGQCDAPYVLLSARRLWRRQPPGFTAW